VRSNRWYWWRKGRHELREKCSYGSAKEKLLYCHSLAYCNEDQTVHTIVHPFKALHSYAAKTLSITHPTVNS